jgi:hypothetical protein
MEWCFAADRHEKTAAAAVENRARDRGNWLDTKMSRDVQCSEASALACTNLIPMSAGIHRGGSDSKTQNGVRNREPDKESDLWIWPWRSTVSDAGPKVPAYNRERQVRAASRTASTSLK